MTRMPPATDQSSVEALLTTVQELAPVIREHAPDAEAQRRLSASVVRAMREAQLYALARPRAYGGLEVDPITMFRVVEELARHDSAAAWNLQLSLAANCCVAWMPDEGASEIMHSRPDAIFATSFTPGRTATPVDGGYRLTGQWPFVSGGHDADWFLFVPGVVERDGSELGVPVQRFMFIPAADRTVLDTWYTLGMRGTGSHDVAVSDVFVPQRRTAQVAPLERPAAGYDGPLYRIAVWVAIGLLVPPALGIAQAAIDFLAHLAEVKTPTFTGSSLAHRQIVQRQIAQAQAELNAGRAYLHQAFRNAWEAAVEGADITLDHKMNIQLAMSHGVVCAARAVDLIHAAAGTSAIRDEHPLQRHFRDVHTITQHAFVSASRYESTGMIMLGLDPDWAFFAL